jgi:hypothetical protein
MTKRIVILILCALILPLAGAYVAAEIEDTQSNPKVALLVWSIFCIGAIALFYSAHLIAKRRNQFSVIGTLALIISLAFMSVFGWLANGAWYDYYFFSDYIKPQHTVQQHSQYPNQFLFKGRISDGAATRVLLASDYRYIHPRAWIGFHATYLIDDDNNITYDSPHLQFFNEQVELRLRHIGVSLFFIDNVNIQYANGGFFPSYTRLKG